METEALRLAKECSVHTVVRSADGTARGAPFDWGAPGTQSDTALTCVEASDVLEWRVKLDRKQGGKNGKWRGYLFVKAGNTVHPLTEIRPGPVRQQLETSREFHPSIQPRTVTYARRLRATELLGARGTCELELIALFVPHEHCWPMCCPGGAVSFFGAVHHGEGFVVATWRTALCRRRQAGCAEEKAEEWGVLPTAEPRVRWGGIMQTPVQGLTLELGTREAQYAARWKTQPGHDTCRGRGVGEGSVRLLASRTSGSRYVYEVTVPHGVALGFQVQNESFCTVGLTARAAGDPPKTQFIYKPDGCRHGWRWSLNEEARSILALGADSALVQELTGGRKPPVEADTLTFDLQATQPECLQAFTFEPDPALGVWTETALAAGLPTWLIQFLSVLDHSLGLRYVPPKPKAEAETADRVAKGVGDATEHAEVVICDAVLAEYVSTGEGITFVSRPSGLRKVGTVVVQLKTAIRKEDLRFSWL